MGKFVVVIVGTTFVPETTSKYLSPKLSSSGSEYLKGNIEFIVLILYLWYLRAVAGSKH